MGVAFSRTAVRPSVGREGPLNGLEPKCCESCADPNPTEQLWKILDHVVFILFLFRGGGILHD